MVIGLFYFIFILQHRGLTLAENVGNMQGNILNRLQINHRDYNIIWKTDAPQGNIKIRHKTKVAELIAASYKTAAANW